jgi:glycosyltransferase involved in cell wall biosynthesis
VVDGVNGVLFRSEDVDDLFDKLVYLIEQPKVCKDLGKRARAWAEHNRNWDVLVERYAEAYTSLLGRS